MNNHRIVVTAHGGPEVLQLIEEELPLPGPGEVRVRVQAAGVSAYDLMSRRSGMLPGSPKIPYTPGLDVVGVVDALGADVSSIELGQSVAAGTVKLGTGGYSEFLCLPAGELFPLPPGLDPAKAVCLVINYVTAHAMLHGGAGVQAGERVLIHGAAGGVGSALVQLGGLAGLEMYGTASAAGQEAVRALGATPIDYRNEDFVARIRELTGDGVDVVFDPIGGGAQLRRSYKALREGGRLIWFGVAGSRGVGGIAATVLTRFFLSLNPDSKTAPMPPDAWESVRDSLPLLFGLLAEGKIDPLVAARLPLAEAAEAHRILERGGYAGKLVLLPDPPAGLGEEPIAG